MMIKPMYSSYCFSKIPATIEHVLIGTGEGLPSDCFKSGEYDTVVFLLLDGLGWNDLQRHKGHNFYKKIEEQGKISKLTAQFPSTTTAEITTINTGLEVGQTGIYEWFQYEPLVDQMISPLLFSYAGDILPESLRASKIAPELFFPFETIYEKFHKKNISSYVLQHASIMSSPYSTAMTKGAHKISFLSFKQGLHDVQEIISQDSCEKKYVILYFPEIDAIGHRKGAASEEVDLAIDSCLTLIDEIWSPKQRVALCISADHGMSKVSPHTTYYLNQQCPEMLSMLKKNRSGKILAPAGSCRDLFLHIEKSFQDEACALIAKKLEGVAQVEFVGDLVKQGFFGTVSSRFLERVGDLVILPDEGNSVFWYEKGRFEQHFYGAHGGLSATEMEIPFLFL